MLVSCRRVLVTRPVDAAQRIRIGAEDDWRPYSYVVEGKPVGFAVDLARAAWAAAGVEVELVPLPYARCMKRSGQRHAWPAVSTPCAMPVPKTNTSGTNGPCSRRVLPFMDAAMPR